MEDGEQSGVMSPELSTGEEECDGKGAMLRFGSSSVRVAADV